MRNAWLGRATGEKSYSRVNPLAYGDYIAKVIDMVNPNS